MSSLRVLNTLLLNRCDGRKCFSLSAKAGSIRYRSNIGGSGKFQTSFDLPDPAKLMSYSDDDSYISLAPSTTKISTNTTSPTVSTTTNITSAASFSTLPDFSYTKEGSSFYEESETQISDIADSVTKTKCKHWTPQLTKIVATIGPTSEQFPVLDKLVRSGLRVMRLNFSHATVEEVELRVKNLKNSMGRHGIAFQHRLSDSKNLRSVLLDTRGPEIRTGKLRDDHSGHEVISLKQGEQITLRTSAHWQDAGSTSSDLFIDYPKLHQTVEKGSKVLLDDGAVILTVEEVQDADKVDGSVICCIDNSGELRSRAGVNLPGCETDLPAITEKDRKDIRYGLTKDVDFIAASFVQNAKGVREIKRYVNDTMFNDLKLDPGTPPPLIISKIESVAALKNFNEILEESDGIMVARGDLGVEIPIQQVTNAQKEMIAACNAVGKPVIVATQMLESMAKNPRPTRAEVADVTNAVYDGADCVMLSGETAKGKYPVETVKMMNEIILGAERFHVDRPDITGKAVTRHLEGGEQSAMMAVAKAAVTAAHERNASAILVATSHGVFPKLVSSFRPNVPIIAFCESEKIARQLMLWRGVHPVIGVQGLSVHKIPFMAIQDAKTMGYVKPGDDVVVLSVNGAEEGFGLCSVMKIATVPEDEVPGVKPEKEEVTPPCV